LHFGQVVNVYTTKKVKLPNYFILVIWRRVANLDLHFVSIPYIQGVPIVVHTQDWWKANLMNHWLKGMRPPSSPDYNPLDYLMWSEIEREVERLINSLITPLPLSRPISQR
jgi:hypothetical protein